MFRRTQTRALKVGDVPIGGGAPVSVQTMGNADPHDAEACLGQLLSCAELGCDLFRLTVPDLEAAKVLGAVRAKSPLPIVADIHFDYRCALAAIENGADTLRLNPGNIGGAENVRAVARRAKEKGVPIRIGVNAGSLERELSIRVAEGRLTRHEALVESALAQLRLLEQEDCQAVVLSVKASDALETIAAYRLLAERTDCPLHVGVTEAGSVLPGTVRSSVALGILLAEGIGDTVRVSLTDRPEQEVRVGLEILRTLGLKSAGPSVTSCPTCGRTRVDLVRTVHAVEEALERHFRVLRQRNPLARLPKVAVMGCAVNGPGEAKDADIALCGGDGEFVLYVKGSPVEKVAERAAVGKVMEYVVLLG